MPDPESPLPDCSCDANPRELIASDLLIPVENDTSDEYLKAAAAQLGIPVAHLTCTRIRSKVLITANPEQFYYKVSLVLNCCTGAENKTAPPPPAPQQVPRPRSSAVAPRPVIIGFGPAGIFAALEFIERGYEPVIFERGTPLDQRDIDVQKFISSRILTPDSNVQFGEGGAGSYSDGKIFSRPNNSPYAAKALDTFVRFGAPPHIAYVAKPHLGTDVLRTIVTNMRTYILSRGAEVHFNAKMTDILLHDGAAAGVVINNTREYRADTVVLGIGNSARDTFGMLYEKGITLEAKPIAVGVRIEHPARTINQIRYGSKYRDFAPIGAATYSFNWTDRTLQRGAYTFCMCPGGEVVNASSEEGLLALNGMSYAARGAPFSNAAIVVTCRTTDYPSPHPLAGIEFQKEIERRAFNAGGKDWHAPAQNLTDFMRGTLSNTLNANSYKMGVRSADMNTLFPAFAGETLRNAFAQWQTECPQFTGEDAILIGAETRTSSPVRITRGADRQCVNTRGIHPIGEGSGYSGGIISAAIDAMKAVEGITNC